MKTLSPTQARANLTRWLDQAIEGQSIGITHKGKVIKLQPVEIVEDWAATKCGLSNSKLDEAAQRVHAEGEKLLKSGKSVSWQDFKRRKKARGSYT
jgi:antitoxin (DNA-binding transcriptional repressor) of toxin-antitoxin stability system